MLKLVFKNIIHLTAFLVRFGVGKGSCFMKVMLVNKLYVTLLSLVVFLTSIYELQGGMLSFWIYLFTFRNFVSYFVDNWFFFCSMNKKILTWGYLIIIYGVVRKLHHILGGGRIKTLH